MGATPRTIRSWLAFLAFIFPAGAGLHAAGVDGQSPAIGTGFPTNRVVRLRIEVSGDAVQRLHEAPRHYVRATVREGGDVFDGVALRLKGRAGSFRPVDEKPSLTLDFERFVPGRRFAGVSKLHLNNSVEDPSFLHDWIGSELFRSAGIPTPLVTHALVELNGRSLGLYVLKEGFDAEFLERSFGSADGNLYEPEPGPGTDVTGPMRRSSGAGVGDRSDLKRLADAAMTIDLQARSRELAILLDSDRCLTFLALEILLGHRDGYALARNNYRLYRNPADGRFVFLPGVMDNLLGRPDAPLLPRMSGTIAAALIEIPEQRKVYRERVGVLLTNQFRVEGLKRMVAARSELLARELSRPAASALRQPVSDLDQRIEHRAAAVASQLAIPELAPLVFTDNVALLDGWRKFWAPTDGVMDEAEVDGVSTLHIRADSAVASSWRTQVWLGRGRYRFEGRVRTRSIKRLPFARRNGVYLTVPEHEIAKMTPLTTDQDWTPLSVEFVVVEENPAVDLQCVIHADSGEAWFDRKSLRLIRVGQ